MPLEVMDISFTYNRGLPQEHKALNKISLQVPDNSYVAVIGHTGSGKSTLMQIMNGLLKPHEGKVFLNGQDIYAKEMSLKAVRQRVGLVFQYPEHQLFEETVFKDVAFGPRNANLPEEEIHRRVMNALKLVGLNEDVFFNASPFNLSGGEKRRVALAGVLAMEPQFLILDEPTAGLDPKGREDIMQAIAKLQKLADISIVLVTHSMEEVAKYAQEVHVLSNGTLIISGQPREVFENQEMLTSAGLRLPVAAEIVSKLRAQGFRLPQVLDIQEAARAIAEEWKKKDAH